MTLNVLRSLLPVLVSATLLSPAGAADKISYLPFKAGMVINESLGLPSYECYWTAPPGGSAATGDISGSGWSTPVGALTFKSTDCITSASPPPYVLPPLTFSSKTVTLKASNGDLITAEYEGTATAQPDGSLVLSGTFTFTGGTGKYVGVRGSGSLDGVEDISTTPAKGFVVLTGRISR